MTANQRYSDLVREVYIDPLRSVLIIDDDYPTWNEILDSGSEQDEQTSQFYDRKKWKRDPAPIKEVISALRSTEGSLILDIDDGSKIEADSSDRLIGNLHQTDLLILDYQLEGTSEDGTKSISILRDVNANENFNLVIVQTSADLDQAFRDILLGLLSPSGEELEPDGYATGLGLIEVAEDDRPEVLEDLRRAFDLAQYLEARRSPKAAMGAFFDSRQPFSQLRQVCEACNWGGRDLRAVFSWALTDFETRNAERMHADKIANLSWSADETKWIRSSTAFLTFTKKRKAADLIGDLHRGLVHWSPLPSRLLLSKLRKELDDRGALAEDNALGNKHVLARWYIDLLKADPQLQYVLMDETINRQSEQLIEEVRPDVVEFFKSLLEHDEARMKNELVGTPPVQISEAQLVQEYFSVNLENDAERLDAELEHNVFVCSTKPSGSHLRTGHVFGMDDKYWVCLSPLCDLVPGQKTSGMFGEIGNRMPFLAVRLQEVEGASDTRKFKNIQGDIQTNRYVFLRDKEKILILCINAPGSKSVHSNPHWYPLYAGEQGVFKDGYSLKVYKPGNARNGHLRFESNDVTVIAQLRYEYALNLMQKLGTTLNRIGLDFSG